MSRKAQGRNRSGPVNSGAPALRRENSRKVSRYEDGVNITDVRNASTTSSRTSRSDDAGADQGRVQRLRHVCGGGDAEADRNDHGDEQQHDRPDVCMAPIASPQRNGSPAGRCRPYQSRTVARYISTARTPGMMPAINRMPMSLEVM